MAASTPELIARIDELMQQSSEVIDIFDIFNHVLLDTTRGYAACLSRSRADKPTVRPWQLSWRLSL